LSSPSSPVGPDASTASPRVFYGWYIVLAAGLGLCLSGPGQSYSIAEFINVYIRQFHLDRATVSTLFSGATMLSGSLLFLVGRQVDRIGYRRSFAVITVLFALACVANSFVQGPVTLFFGFFLARFLGQGSVTLVPNALVPQWFVRRRGIALSLMSVGSLVGAAAIPLVNTWLIATWGSPWAWRFWAAVILVVLLPVAAFVVRDRPEEVGLLPDGAAAAVPGAFGDRPRPAYGDEDAGSFTVRDAMRTTVFWLLLFCVVVPAMLHTAITIQMFSILGTDGVPPAASADILSVFALVSFAGTMLSGYLLDRFRPQGVVAAGFVLMAVELLMLLFVRTTAEAFAFAIVWGLASGMLNVAFSFIWPAFFGRRHLGGIRGMTATFMVLGTAVGPALFGWAFQLFGGYHQILVVSLLFPLVSAVIALVSRPPAPTRMTAVATGEGAVVP